MKHKVSSGIDRISEFDHLLKGKRIGLMTNPTGINRNFESTIDILHSRYGLSALFACEHGVRGDRQAGEEVSTYIDEETGLTVYSTYGKSNRMSEEMLAAFDVLVFDIQDVGVRFYTYLYSLSYAMEACAAAGKQVLVLDRINPIGGHKAGGTILDLRFSSFVGDYELPTRLGLTIGEYALYIKEYLKLDLDLTVASLSGWSRDLYLDDTDLPWVAPSPNCPDLAAALCYVGTCIFEGVNVSEGRGTTQPFQLIGAPFINAKALKERMNTHHLPGVHFRPTSFVPTFSKHAGTLCHGVQMHILDREQADSFHAGLLLLETIWQLHPDEIEFISWDDGVTHSLDKLLGTNAFRKGELGAKALLEKHKPGIAAFREASKPYMLYE